MRRIFFPLPGTSDPSPSLLLPLHNTPKTSSLPKKSLKCVLFDLTIIASFVAAACLGGRGFGKALSVPKQPGSAAIGSDYNTTESALSTLIENSRQLQELHQIKLDVTEEKTRLRDELIARAFPAARVNLPLTDGDGEEDLTESLSQADDVLLQIELSERVLELDRLSLPLSAGMTAMGAGLRDAGPPEQTRLVMRYLHDNAARLDEFKGKVAAFHELDARLVGRGGELGEGYREKMDGYERLNGVIEDLRHTFEELRTTMRSVGSTGEL